MSFSVPGRSDETVSTVGQLGMFNLA
jgi:hypothetical protein